MPQPSWLNSSSSSSMRRAVEAAGLRWASVLGALKAQERALFARSARADAAFLCAFVNAAAAPPSSITHTPTAAAAAGAAAAGAAAAVSAAGSGEALQQQQQQQQAVEDFAEAAQRHFVPLKLLRSETFAEVYRHALPRELCGDPEYLLQHWRDRVAAVAALQQQQQQQQQAATAAASGEAGESADDSAAGLLMRDLQCTDSPEVLKTPSSYVRFFISSKSSISSSSRLEAGPERLLRALLLPLKSSPASFSPAACAALLRVAVETGIAEPLLLEKVLLRLSEIASPTATADNSSISSSSSSRSSSSSGSGVSLLPAAALVDVLRAVAAAPVVTRPVREALEKLVDTHSEDLLRQVDLAPEAMGLLQRLDLLQLQVLARVLQQQVSLVQRQLQQPQQQRRAISPAAADMRGLALCMQTVAASASAQQAMRRAVASRSLQGPPSGRLKGPPDDGLEASGASLLGASALAAELVTLIQAAQQVDLVQVVHSTQQQQQQQQRTQHINVVIPPLALVQLLQGCATLPWRQRAAEAVLALLLLLQRTSSSSSGGNAPLQQQQQQQQHQFLVCEALRVATDVLVSRKGAPSALNCRGVGGPNEAPDASQILSRLQALAAAAEGDLAAATQKAAAAAAAGAAAMHSTSFAAVLERIVAAGEVLLRQQVLPHFSLLLQRDLVSLASWYTSLLLWPAAAATAAAATAATAGRTKLREERMQGLLRVLRSLLETSRGQPLEETDRTQLALAISFLRHEAPVAWAALGPAGQHRLGRLASRSN
ncbi:hypothetical protein ACSSS7_005871 [Eimeria intestinalis]